VIYVLPAQRKKNTIVRISDRSKGVGRHYKDHLHPHPLSIMSAPFKLPTVADTQAWGPVGLSAQFRDIPYAPYSKADKLGRIADWSAPEGTQGKDNRGGAGDQRGGRPGFRNFRGIFFPRVFFQSELFTAVDNF
jgi:hypothetical protein